MASEETVTVHGLVETEAALSKLAVEAPLVSRLALVEAGRPMASEARSLISRYRGASLSTIRARPTALGVQIVQDKGPVTGDHPNLGALEMAKGLVPAVSKHEADAVRAVELAIDRLSRLAGF